MPHVVIVGAGISGLSTAHYLLSAVPNVALTILESNNRPGGTIWTERHDGFQIEVGANAFQDSKPSTLDLCRNLGLSDRLIAAGEAAKHRFLLHHGRLTCLPEGLWSFIRSPLLSWRGKLSLLMERCRSRRRDGADESVRDFVVRRGGSEAELFADALVTGIHAGDPALLSMGAAFPRIAEMEQRHGGVMKGMAAAAKDRRAAAAERGEAYQPPRLWSFRGGLRLLIETLAGRLHRQPTYGVRVRRIELTPAARPNWVVHGEGQERWQADAVVIACPAQQQAAMLADWDATLATSIGAIPYSPAAVVALGYRRADVPGDLNGFGYIAPQRDRRDLLGVQWCSSLFPDRAPAEHVLLRGIAGGWHRADIMSWDDDRLLRAVRHELRLAMGIEAAPVFHHLVRWERAIPQYHLGHLERVTRIEALAAAHPGLFLAGNAYHGVALNDCTEQGELVARRVAAYLGACGLAVGR